MSGRVRWHTPIIPAFQKLRQEAHWFRTNLDILSYQGHPGLHSETPTRNTVRTFHLSFELSIPVLCVCCWGFVVCVTCSLCLLLEFCCLCGLFSAVCCWGFVLFAVPLVFHQVDSLPLSFKSSPECRSDSSHWFDEFPSFSTQPIACLVLNQYVHIFYVR